MFVEEHDVYIDELFVEFEVLAILPSLHICAENDVGIFVSATVDRPVAVADLEFAGFEFVEVETIDSAYAFDGFVCESHRCLTPAVEIAAEREVGHNRQRLACAGE